MIFQMKWSRCGLWHDTLMDGNRSNNLLALQSIDPPDLSMRLVRLSVGPLSITIGYLRRVTTNRAARAALRAEYTAKRRAGAFPPCDNCIPIPKKSKEDDV